MGRAGRCVGLTILPPSCADFHEIWEPQPPGNLRACPGPVQGLLYIYIYVLYDKPFRKTTMIINYNHSINILLSKLLLWIPWLWSKLISQKILNFKVQIQPLDKRSVAKISKKHYKEICWFELNIGTFPRKALSNLPPHLTDKFECKETSSNYRREFSPRVLLWIWRTDSPLRQTSEMIGQFSQNTMTVAHKIKRICVPEKCQVGNVKAEALHFPLLTPNEKAWWRLN